jgi:cytochrome c oxidase assembly factor CtaG
VPSRPGARGRFARAHPALDLAGGQPAEPRRADAGQGGSRRPGLAHRGPERVVDDQAELLAVAVDDQRIPVGVTANEPHLTHAPRVARGGPRRGTARGTPQNQAVLGLAGIAVAAYGGPPEPHARSAVTAWTFQPFMALVVLGLGAAYAAGVRACRRHGEPWRGWRTGMFFAGLAVVVVATMGWPGRYAHVLLTAYATQFLLMLLLAPALLAIGSPLGLAARALPPPWGGRVSAFVAGPVAKVVLSPAVAPAVVPLATGAAFFTPLLGWSLRHGPVLVTVQVVVLTLGFVFALPLAGEDGGASSLTIGIGIFLGLLELLLDAIPGFVLRNQTHLLQPGYWSWLARPWGTSPEICWTSRSSA